MRLADDDSDEPPEHVDPSVLEDRRTVADTFTSAAAAADVRQVPALLCQACVELPPITGASTSITDGTTVRALWCASDRTASRLAEAQYTLSDGPCQTALARTAPVPAADLTRGPDARRRPVFAHQATELGVRAVFSLPLGTSALAIGTLDLYRATPGAPSDRDDRDLRIALPARDAVTFAMLKLDSGTDDYAPADGAGVASWVEAAEADPTESTKPSAWSWCSWESTRSGPWTGRGHAPSPKGERSPRWPRTFARAPSASGRKRRAKNVQRAPVGSGATKETVTGHDP
ncbi:hypothetical protein [Streptomyces sp. V4I2]|uniref:GAF domain-containing protein n=1 Tax=Streptomyces sp. V4I2 TaxID=3042280 RepID=UPI00277D4F12|nr:hypothetical protein [Streptomyces sp. V4I2]MDQ1042644.1 hypothetical protein [Streptomyces sp. V4I2]